MLKKLNRNEEKERLETKVSNISEQLGNLRYQINRRKFKDEKTDLITSFRIYKYYWLCDERVRLNKKLEKLS